MKLSNLFFTISLLAFSFAVNAKSVIVKNTQNTGTGSLNWAIQQANADATIDSILFNIPRTDPGCDTARGVWVIEVTTKRLTTINAHNLVIDGESQTRFTGNSNTVMLGSGASVGCDGINLSKIDGPEIEIVDKGGHKVGFNINGNNIKVRCLGIFGFGNKYDAFNANIVICPTRYNITIEKNIIGASITSFSAPSEANNGNNIAAANADTIIIKNNLIGFAGHSGIYSSNYKGKSSEFWTIENNEIIGNGILSNSRDGIDISKNGKYFTIVGNLIKLNAANGIDTWGSDGEWTITNNTISSNGKGGVETAGIRLAGETGVISKNKIEGNYGAGIRVSSGAKDQMLSENCICNNGNITGNGSTAKSNDIGIDNQLTTDDQNKGKSPFYSINDNGDVDNGGNKMTNTPVFESCELVAGKIVIKGWVGGNAKVEIFKACTYLGATFPQGEEFISSFVEGSSADNSTAVSKYGPGEILGVIQGEDSTNRFEYSFTPPSGIGANSLLTATATILKNTSEFGAGCKVVVPTAKIIPKLECVYKEINGTYSARFGYSNPNAGSINISTGTNNEFSPSPIYRGQDTVFMPGRKFGTFEVNFTGNSITWKLDGSTVIASKTSNLCPADVKVEKVVSNSAPNKNDTVQFTITVTNTKMVPLTNVVIYDSLQSAFNLVSTNASSGSYVASTGIWTIPSIAKGGSETLTMSVKVDTNGENLACFVSAEQTDGNSFNNCGVASICVKGTGGGNGGGLESNGDLASIIATTKYRNRVVNQSNFYENIGLLQDFNKQSSASRAGSSSLERFIPLTGPNGTSAKITSPTNLIAVSNAEEVFAVDYFDGTRRLGSILAINSTNGESYEHTKVICDRLDGSSLTHIRYETINNVPFIISTLIKDNGDQDYAISFIAVKKANGTFVIDNQWNRRDYKSINATDSVFNFQVWSISPNETRKMVESIIVELNKSSNVTYSSTYPPVIPTVWVQKGEYKKGNLELTINNTIGAGEVLISGNRAYVENGTREYLDTAVDVSVGGILTINVPTDFIFDAGFELTNNKQGGTDILYLADGPWGIDYEKNAASTNSFKATKFDPSYVKSNEYGIERGVEISGTVKTEINIFKSMRVSDRSVDVDAYNQLVFKAKATGVTEMEIIVSKESVTKWEEQFRITVPVTTNMKEYKIGFPTLKSTNSTLTFDAKDVLTITYQLKGNEITQRNFDLKIDRVKLNSDFVSNVENVKEKLESGISVFPNPSNGYIQLYVNSKLDYNASIVVYDMKGQVVFDKSNYELLKGENNMIIDLSNLNSGTYILKVNGLETEYSRFVISK